MSAGELDGLLGEFLVESHENLDRADRDFIALERDPSDRETLARIFRTVHTIKGSCGFLGLGKLEALAHAGESLMGRLRDGELTLDEPMTTALLGMVDAIRAVLATIEQTGAEGADDHAGLVAELDRLRQGRPTGGGTTSEAVAATGQAGGLDDSVRAFLASAQGALEQMDAAFTTLSTAPGDQEALGALESGLGLIREGSEFIGLAGLARLLEKAMRLLGRHRAAPERAEPAVAEALLDVASAASEILATLEATGRRDTGAHAPLHAALDALLPADAAPTPTPAPAQPVSREPAGAEDQESRTERAIRRASVTEKNIRVDVDLLDKLMNQVGELVLARNQMLQHLLGSPDKALGAMTQRLSQITTELQESVMLTRLQPIETIWSRLPRMVRDLALELGKRVRLEMIGAHTELDRTLLEAIRGPMTHLVRNAIDHGIETEQERVAAGKPPEGVLTLRAWHEGGQVNLEIHDDGKGVDTRRIEQKALQSGLITPEQARTMSDAEKRLLIFLPGFSTAERVTTVSGRGVGMDVVKSSIDRINGLIDLRSEPGQGTTLRLKIPLTLAIIPALIVTCGDERYAIPQISLVAVVRLEGTAATQGIERLHSSRVHRWRGRLLPIVELRAELGLDPALRAAAEPVIDLVVLQAEDRLFGLVVDEVGDSGEIVVKPLGRLLSRVPVYAGATIMGDGRAAMILDVLGLAEATAVASGQLDARTRTLGDGAAEAAVDTRTVLIVRLGVDRGVIPLTEAMRLERFDRSAVEKSGQRYVVRYRGSVLPLERVGTGTDDPTWDPRVGDEAMLNVVVFAEDGESVGLVVDELLDIVDTPLVVRGGIADGRGVVGTTVIQGHVAHVLDLARIARRAEVGR